VRNLSRADVRLESGAPFSPSPQRVRSTPDTGHIAASSGPPLRADFVAKVFLAPGRETLIQNLARARNVDSKTHSPRFDYFKIQFHRAGSETFATKSASCGLMNRSNYSITSSARASSVGGTSRPSVRAPPHEPSTRTDVRPRRPISASSLLIYFMAAVGSRTICGGVKANP
jgi:hypothetical protein